MAKKLDDKVLDGLLGDCKTPADVSALYSQLLQRVINRSLEGEMDAHLGYERNEKSDTGRRANARNGSTPKTIKGTFGDLSVVTPRDREGTFEPQLVKEAADAARGLRGQDSGAVRARNEHARHRERTG